MKKEHIKNPWTTLKEARMAAKLTWIRLESKSGRKSAEPKCPFSACWQCHNGHTRKGQQPTGVQGRQQAHEHAESLTRAFKFK
jgi:hypothetical protein